MSQTEFGFIELPGQAGILLQTQVNRSPTENADPIPEQEALIVAYCQKWKSLGLKSGPINRQKATEAVKAAYAAMALKEPLIVFYHSPHTAFSTGILSQPKKQLGKAIYNQLENQLLWQLFSLLFPLLLEKSKQSPQLRSLLSWGQLSPKEISLTQTAEEVNLQEINLLRLQQFFQSINVMLGMQSPQTMSLMGAAPLAYQLGWDSDSHSFQWISQGEPISHMWWPLVKGAMASVVKNHIGDYMGGQLGNQLETLVGHQIGNFIGNFIGNQVGNSIGNQIGSLLGSDTVESIKPEVWSHYGGWFDFCISVLSCEHDQRKWEAYQSLVKDCGWIFPFENVCVVCDRPVKLSVDSEQRLHAEGEPALQYADGYSLYAYHGVTLPEKYGQLHPHQWQAQWLLEERNAEYRRVLIQEIGYARICQELQAIELDSWQEYTLLKIDYVNLEPLYLLKMTCPSTGFIHALRVPSDVESAREAIRWVNWGTDSEEFSVQT